MYRPWSNVAGCISMGAVVSSLGGTVLCTVRLDIIPRSYERDIT